MRVRVELRREGGEFIPRFRPQEGFRGELVTRRKEVSGRSVVYVTVQCEPLPGFPSEVPEGPELFEPRILDSPPDEWRLLGWEVVGRAIHCQEWDCFILPDLPRRR